MLEYNKIMEFNKIILGVLSQLLFNKIPTNIL